VLRRAEVVTNSYFAGRIGEGAWLSFEHFLWYSPFQTFVIIWPEMKTVEQKPYVLVHNPNNFEIDIVHALGCQAMFGGGGHNLPRDYDMESCSVLPQLTAANAGSRFEELYKSVRMVFKDGVMIGGVEG
jgi:hypothetical protein